MLNREKYEDAIIDIANNNMHRKAFRRLVADEMKEKHNVLSGRVNQLLNGTKEFLSQASDEELYWLAVAVGLTLGNNGMFDEYFSNRERSEYSHSRVQIENEELYPVIFKNTLEVSATQWCTVINVNQLYDLYKKQLINYNKNTQRQQRRRERNGLVEYKIYLNSRSVKEIKELLKEKRFIPNTLTFNINLDDENNEAVYKNGTLYLTKGSFDIIDGFHRYKALMECKNEDPAFDFNIILSIMRFDENKAAQFIAQEDKRNKISKRIIQSMDATNLINVVIQSLNDNTASFIRGQIGRTASDRINSLWLFDMINKCFVVNDMKGAIELQTYLRIVINRAVEEGLLEKADFLTLAVIIKAAAMYKDDPDAVEKAMKIVRRKEYLPKEFQDAKQVTRTLLDEIEKLEKWG